MAHVLAFYGWVWLVTFGSGAVLVGVAYLVEKWITKWLDKRSK
jgi:hypothetical protein